MIDRELDKQILDYIISDAGKIIPGRANERTMKNRGWYDYLMQRYDDNTTDYLLEIFYRLKNNMDDVPVCCHPDCNNIIKFSYNSKIYPTYCCPKCQNTSPEMLEKNRAGVSKALKEVYAERKDEIQAKRAKTLSDRYGVDTSSGSPFSVSHVREKIKMVNLERYGVENVMYLPEYHKDARKIARELSVKLWKERGLDIEYDDNNIIVKNGCPIHGDISVPMTMFNNRTKPERIHSSVLCPICHKKEDYSGEEAMMARFLDSLNITYSTNDRSVIKPLELDFYLPDYKLAIEMNGLYYHSEQFGKDKYYHKNKSDKCDALGVKLIHIWENEWKNQQDIVISNLKRELGQSDRVINAIDCTIKRIDASVANSFYNVNHLNGWVDSTYQLGMFYNDELVFVMSFGKFDEDNDAIELMRFCYKNGVDVKCAFDRVISFAEKELKEVEVKSIIYYSDRNWNNGDECLTCGFKYIEDIEPDYFVVDYDHREIYDKEDIDEDKIDESDIFIKCWTCGKKKFIKAL